MIIIAYIHTYIHAYIHTYIHTYIHAYTHTYIHTYIYTYIHIYIHTYIYTYVHTYIHTGITIPNKDLQIVQRFPIYPLAHAHLKLLTLSVHVPKFSQCSSAQSSISGDKKRRLKSHKKNYTAKAFKAFLTHAEVKLTSLER